MQANDDILYAAKVCAVKLMGKMSYTYSGMIKKLCEKGYDCDIAQEAADHYKELGYLDDGEYAKKYIYDAAHLKNYGRERIEYGLRQKGVDGYVIEDAFAELDIDFFELAKQLAEKRFAGKEISGEKERAKFIGFMRRRGFSYEQINYAIDEYTE